MPGLAGLSRTHRVLWTDGLRILGALLIFLFHFGNDYEASVLALDGTGGLGGLFSMIYPHFSEWGISLFVVLMGTTIAFSSSTPSDYAAHLWRRARRLLLPLWIIGLPYVAVGLLLGEMTTSDAWKVPFWFTGLGAVSPETFFPVSAAWWYVSLAIQFAAVSPLIRTLVDRIGIVFTSVTLAGVSLLAVTLIGGLPDQWHYLTQGLVLARLVEVALGLLAGHVALRSTSPTAGTLSLGVVIGSAAAADALGARASFTTVVLWASVLGVLALLYATRSGGPRLLTHVALGTYPFYLVHAPIGKYSMRALNSIGLDSFVLLAVVAFCLSCLAAAVVMLIETRIRDRSGQTTKRS